MSRRSNSLNSPYSNEKFVELVSNFKPILHKVDAEKVIEAHKSFFDYMDRLPGTACFIFDFTNFKYLLFSKAIRNMVGIQENELLQGGFGKALEYFHPEDRENVYHIHKELFGFIHRLQGPEVTHYRFDFNYRFRNVNGEYVQILQQSIITALSEENMPLYDFSTCTDITPQKKNNTMELNIYRKNEQGVFELVYNYTVPSTIGFGLTATEFRVLRFCAEGMTARQIAHTLSRSEHTINNHKKNILFKTDAASLAEAIHRIGL